MKPTLDSEGLAEILHISVHTLYNRRAKDQASVPLPLDMPGNPIWLYDDVIAWLRERSPYHVSVPSSGKAGRPRKFETNSSGVGL